MTRLPLRVSGARRGDLQAQRLEIFYGNTITELGAGTLISALVAVSVWGQHTRPIVIPWLGGLFVIYAVRWALGGIYRRSFLGRDVRTGSWLTLYLCGAAATGVAWGVLVIALAGIVTPYQLSFVLLWTCCLGILVLPIYRGALHPVAAMMPPALLPPSVYYLLLGGDFFVAAAVMLAVVMMVLIGAAAAADWTLSVTLQLGEENRRLSSQAQVREKQRGTRGFTVDANATERGRTQPVLQLVCKQLVEAKRKSKALAATLVRVAPKCAVTGLVSQRHFRQVLDTEWRRSMRDQRPVSLAVFDFDGGETDGEFYRSAAGIKCLQAVARLAQGCARRSADAAVRFDERRFGLLFPGVDATSASRLADGLRQRIEAHRFTLDGKGTNAGLTVHAGVASICPARSSTVEDLLGRVDCALTEAKHQGGNRVVSEPDLADLAARAEAAVASDRTETTEN